MGVKHLWTILQGAGTSFDYESLQGQVISVDINIWLHQIQSHRVGQNPHAYLIDLLKRICKLLHYGIKPIFVFDGAHPKLKRDTINSRDLRRKKAQNQYDEAKLKHILKTVHSQLLQGQVPCLTSSSSGPPDLFELPSSSTVFETDPSEDEYDDLTSIQQLIQLNPKSEEFSNLPSDLKTGILALQSKINITSIPNDHSGNLDDMRPEDVSNEQIRKLQERRKVRQTIENINKEKKQQTNNSVIGVGSQNFRVQSEKVISEETKHIVLVKNTQNDSKFSITSNVTETGTMDQSLEPYTPVTHVDRYYELTGIPEVGNGELTNQIVPDITNNTEQPKKFVKVSLTNGTQFFAEQEMNGKLTSITTHPHSQSSIQDINPACVCTSVQLPHGMDNLSPHMDCMHLSANQQQGFKRSKSPKYNFKSNTADLGLVIPPKSAVKCLDSLASDEVFNTPSFTPHAKRVCVQDTPALDIEPNLELYTETVPNSFSEESIPPTPISPSYDTSGHHSPSSVPLPISPSDTSDLSNDTIRSSLHSPTGYPDLAPNSHLEEVRREMTELSKEMTRRERMIHGVNREIQDAVMELLNVFGIPFIVAPFEAEAQCANLELNMVTTGTITDDSDIFLFGGRTVYRHFFNMKSQLGPQCYSMSNIKKVLDLEREDLVRLAFLLGCDYTEGVKGIGPKHATVLLKSFKSEALRPLTNILAAAEAARSGVKEKFTGEEGLLSRVDFPRGFPDENVWVAFMTPLVDPVPLEEFKWGSIDVEKFVNFSKSYFNWKETQAREQITPVLRRQSTPKQTQLVIPRCTPKAPPQEPIKADYKISQLSSGSDSD